MEIRRTSLENCSTATGTVVVIDVLRAFSTAAYAFAAGATRIILTGSPEEAFALREHNPDAYLMGEVGGWLDGLGDEDAACADYIEALLNGEDPDTAPFTRRVRESPAGAKFTDPTRPEFPASDLDYCLEVNRFNFAMPVKRQDQHMVLYAVPQPG